VFDVIQVLGKALPCSVTAVSGSIVTVKFLVTSGYTLPTVTVPMIGSEYSRPPIQIGCKGLVRPADARLGGITGLGGGIADLSLPANLSALVFEPISSKDWSTTDDPNAYVIYGPDGAVIRTTAGTCKIVVNASGVTVTLPVGMPMTVNGNLVVSGALQLSGTIEAVGGGTYAGDLQTAGNVIAGVGGADQVGLKTHLHAGVTTGAGSTAAPTAGT
jgi:hypothetical protein